MANTNDFVGWALANGANILSVTNYKAATIRQQGSQIGIADPLTFNNSIRQATSVAAMVAQFTADYNTLTAGAGNVQDNADLVTLEAQFVNALTALITSLITPITGTYYHFGGTETGTSGAYVLASPSPAVSSLTAGTTIIFKPSRNSVGSDTLNVSSLGVKAIVREDGSAIQAGDINSSGFPLVAYDGTRWVLVALLQTVAGVPVATTIANGIARQATTAEMTAGATSGSTPAFVTPEGLAIYSEPKWTHVSRSASGTETKYNEFISLTGSANFTTTIATAVGVALGYIISNDSTANQNIASSGGTFYGGSDVIGGTTFLLIPPGAIVLLRADGTNWEVQGVYAPATTANRGQVRMANDTEGTNGVTTGTSPSAMTPERVALFFAAHVANTTTRGIARQATTAEMTAGATSGSSPAFVTPEGIQREPLLLASNAEYPVGAVVPFWFGSNDPTASLNTRIHNSVKFTVTGNHGTLNNGSIVAVGTANSVTNCDLSDNAGITSNGWLACGPWAMASDGAYIATAAPPMKTGSVWTLAGPSLALAMQNQGGGQTYPQSAFATTSAGAATVVGTFEAASGASFNTSVGTLVAGGQTKVVFLQRIS